MSDLSKVFGFILFTAGTVIAIVYTAWVVLCCVSNLFVCSSDFDVLQPCMEKTRNEMFGANFPSPLLLLQLPALALAAGITLIYLFIIKTEKAIAEKKRKQAEAAKKAA